jgi:hypothetical protein
MDETSAAGECAMLRAASSVLPGIKLPAGASLKSVLHAVPPAVVQAASALASVLSFVVGGASPEGIPLPGAVPEALFERRFAVTNASVSPPVFVQLAPTLPPADMKGASAQTAAIVVTSFRTMEVPVEIEPHGPSAVINQREGLEALPGWPPFDSR